ncbi:TetR/AcrR family transcriptional regulator [Rossellomorea oryzaecorticis]|uniref:TetR/AcrR family transcriptional regulator n=1 Tax=Rossellomorea oryzaecorticis TaxID=1396505 RepID=A0ABU9KFS9_9BACI
MRMKQDNKNRIKKTALRLFGQKGYEDTSLHAIASSVGIKKPSIYNHFANKEDIFSAVLDDLLFTETTAYHQLHQEMKQGLPKANLKQLFDLYCSRLMTTEEALLWKRVTFFPPPQFKKIIEEKFFQFEDTITCILSAIYEDALELNILQEVDKKDFVASFLCLVDGIFLEHHYYSEDIFQQRMNAVWRVYTLGIFNGKGE